jgi:hypothetical protein
MESAMEKVLAKFTPARRKALYSALIPLFAILVAHGLVTADDAASVIESLGFLLGVGAVSVARANVNDDTE